MGLFLRLVHPENTKIFFYPNPSTSTNAKIHPSTHQTLRHFGYTLQMIIYLKHNEWRAIANIFFTQEGIDLLYSYRNRFNLDGHIPFSNYHMLLDSIRRKNQLYFNTPEVGMILEFAEKYPEIVTGAVVTLANGYKATVRKKNDGDALFSVELDF